MRKFSQLVSITASLLLCCLIFEIQAEETGTRHYKLPGHGNLQLRIPVSWKDDLRQPPHELPPTIDFKPETGKPFEILITPIWPISKDMQPLTADRIKAQVRRVAEHAKSQSVERDIRLKELKGDSGVGYYFFATDRAPKQDEYKYMTQGMILVGNIALGFTILTNEGQDDVIDNALTTLKSAAHMEGNAT